MALHGNYAPANGASIAGAARGFRPRRGEREKGPGAVARGLRGRAARIDQTETAAIALATYARLPSLSAATQMRPESTP